MRSTWVYIIFFLILTSQVFSSTSYYVDATNGNDSNNGTSKETAWQSLAKVNNHSFSPGDKILLKRGEIWRERLIPSSYGTAEKPITYSTYGEGAKPIISGADIITSFAHVSDNVYSKSGIALETHFVAYNGEILTEDDGATSGVSLNKWDWHSNTLYVNVGENPDNGLLEASQKWQGLVDIEVEYVVIDGLYLTMCNSEYYGGVYIKNSNNTVRNCEIKYAHHGGVFLNRNGATYSINNIWVDNCKIWHTDGPGIYMYATATNSGGSNCVFSNNTIMHTKKNNGIGINQYCSGNNIIEHNYLYDVVDDGIGVGGSQGGNVIRYNEVHYSHGYHVGGGITTMNSKNDQIYGNVVHGVRRTNASDDIDGNGIIVDLNSPNSKIYYNICYNNEGAGIKILSPSAEVYNNVCYKNGLITARGATENNANISIRGYADNCIVRNNICFDNQNVYEIEIQEGLNGFDSDFNCFHHSAGGSFLCLWDAAETFAQWQGAGHDLNGQNSNPSFVKAGNSDFRLQSISSCIDAGIDVGLTQDFDGNTVPIGWSIDIGAYEYQDDTPGIPVVSLFAYPTEGIPPLEVSFDASASYDPDGNITSYEWDFGDNNTGSGITVTHTYQNSGTYTAKLTVTDNDEQSASTSQEIKAGTPPIALFEAFPLSGNTPLKVEFDASISYDTDGEIVSYNWDFGDGTQGKGIKVIHTYYDYGDHTATLKITDDDGFSDSTSLKIKVTEKPFPPLNVKVRRVTNKGNSFNGYCRVEWRRNPKNFGRHNIVKYRIYRKIRYTNDSAYVLIKEVSRRTFKYADKSIENIKELNLYAYAVSAVDDKNRESELSEATFIR